MPAEAPEIEPPVPQRSLAAALFSARTERFLRRSAGRETFRWAHGFDWPVIVKRMPGRGGRREHDNLEALRADGFPVPRPITWAQEGLRGLLGSTVRSLVVMEEIQHEETLRDRFRRGEVRERERGWRELLELVVRLHEKDWYHRDLYLQHVLIRPAASAQPLVLIDVGRARRDPFARRRWYEKDLAAILHSCPENIGRFERLRFLASYLDRRGVTQRSQRRSFARGVFRRARRMARHVPRDERSIERNDP